MYKKHTPAPWSVSRKYKSPEWYVSAGTLAVAECCNADAEANARLIGVSPELLLCLEDAVDILSKYLPINHPSLVNARAAIAKARGQ